MCLWLIMQVPMDARIQGIGVCELHIVGAENLIWNLWESSKYS